MRPLVLIVNCVVCERSFPYQRVLVRREILGILFCPIDAIIVLLHSALYNHSCFYSV